jgi:hypothetical protein
MAGKTYIKTGTNSWNRIKKIYLKTGGITWSPIRKVYLKTGASTWRKVYDTASNRPFISGNDIPKIRLNTFRTNSSVNFDGTINDPVNPVVEAPPVQQMGPSWTSPTLGWPYESLGRHLWGYDGSWTSGNGSTITFIYQWLYNLTGNSNDNRFDPQFWVSDTSSSVNTSSTGRADMLSNLANYLGYNDGDYFDKNFLTFRVGASNSAGGPVYSESAPVYIVREVPTGSITMVSPGTAATNSTMSASFTYSNNWYNKTNVSNSYIEWFAVDNLGDSLTNSNRVQIEYLSSISVTGTTSKSGTTFHVPTIGNKYYYVKMTLNNSGTENAVIAINGFTPKSSVTSQANKTVVTGAALTAPTSTSIVSMSRLTDTTVRAVIGSSGGSGPYYQLWWVSSSTAPTSENRYDAASTTSTVTEDSSFASGFTYYFYIRSSSENLGNTTTNGTGTAGTFSAYGPTTGAASYTFAHPSGSVSVSPSSGTAGTTQFTATPSISASPEANISYQWQYFEGGSFGWLAISGATSSTYTPPSNYVTLYGSNLRCLLTANNGISSSTSVVSFETSSSVTVNAAVRSTNVARRVTMPSNFTNSSQNVWVGTNGYVSVTADPTTSPGTSWPTAGGVVVGPGVSDLVQSSLSTKSDSSNFWVYWKGYRLGDATKELWYLMKFTWNSTTVDVWFERYTLTDGSDDAVRSGNTQYSTWANSTSISTFAVPTTGMVSSTTNNGVDDNRTQITATKPALNLTTNPAYGSGVSKTGGWTATISTAPSPTGGTYSVVSYTAGTAPTINSSTGALNQTGLSAGASSSVTVRYSLSGYNAVDITASGTASSVSAPTIISGSGPVNTNTSNTRNFSVTNGSWNNSPTSYSYQWKATTYLPYPPYSSTVNVGTNSSSYSGISTYDGYGIYCIVTATNAGGDGTATSNQITQSAPTVSNVGNNKPQGAPSITYDSANSTSTKWAYDVTITKSTIGVPDPSYYLQWFGDADASNYVEQTGPYTSAGLGGSFVVQNVLVSKTYTFYGCQAWALNGVTGQDISNTAMSNSA